MFYFDEDHMEDGFDAPVHGSDSETEEMPRHEKSNGRCDSSDSFHHRGFGRHRDDSDSFFPGGFESSGGESEGEGCEGESDGLPELVPMRLPSARVGSIGGRGDLHNHHHRSSRSKNTTFYDFYKLSDEKLGAGAYATVRTCTSKATGQEFAVKVVDKHEAGHSRSRLLHEVDTFKMCKNHPNIVQLVEYFEDEDYFYMVFEKMRGGPLLSHIQRKVFFTEHEAAMVTRDIASALKFLHDRGIAHRDVKPENILCTEPDRVSPVKLCDLDLASKAVPSSPPKLPMVASEPDLASPVGSAEFMAPEVVDAFVGDALKYDKRCDMWSLGVILYIMLCGYPPFYGECMKEDCGWDEGAQCDECQEALFARIQRGEFDFPEEEWASVSDDAKDLIKHLLVKNVRERFTADDVLAHRWLAKDERLPRLPLQTAGNLFRNDSARDVHQISEHFNVMNRMVAARLSARMDKDGQGGGGFDEDTHLMPPPATVIWGGPGGKNGMVNGGVDYGPSPPLLFVPTPVQNGYQKMVCGICPMLLTSLQSQSQLNGLTPSTPVEQLESCGSAMARQDSKNNLYEQTQRETQVNV